MRFFFSLLEMSRHSSEQKVEYRRMSSLLEHIVFWFGSYIVFIAEYVRNSVQTVLTQVFWLRFCFRRDFNSESGCVVWCQ